MGKKAQFQRKDRLYEQAKEDGFRSRASYKLIELDQRYHLLQPGAKVLDLGCWPGGWLEVASDRVGTHGCVVGIDLVELSDLGKDNVKLIAGDAAEDRCISAARQIAGSAFDLILSDMSPKLTGIKEVDRAGSLGCAELALWVAHQLLRQKGNFVTKVFKSNEAEQFVKGLRQYFDRVERRELESTRRSSNEYYVVGLGIKNATPAAKQLAHGGL